MQHLSSLQPVSHLSSKTGDYENKSSAPVPIQSVGLVPGDCYVQCDSIPSYSRDSQQCGIVHFGVGAFHRSHLAYFMDVLANDFNQTAWAICGVGIRSSDERELKFASELRQQQCLYTLITKQAETGSDSVVNRRIIGSIVKYLHSSDENGGAKIVSQLVSTSTKIVSLTITENGYNIDGTGQFMLNHPDVKHDLALENNDRCFRTVFGYIVCALDIRRKLGHRGFTVMSCDNLASNGDMIKKCILAFIQASGNNELLEWVISGNVCFPNSMVDCITPVTTSADIEYLRNLGLEDNCPVVCEEYKQWVLEDSFVDNCRPPLELLSGYNVLLTSEVQSYELLKLRLLNSTHTALCYLGVLNDKQFIHEIFQDESMAHLAMNMIVQEVIPTLPVIEGISPEEYGQSVIKRFSNGAIADRCARVCADGATKMTKFLLPIVKHQLTTNGPISYLSLAVASWIVFLFKNDDLKTPLIDTLAHELDLQAKIRTAYCSKSRYILVPPILLVKQVFDDLGENITFVTAVQSWVQKLQNSATPATLQ